MEAENARTRAELAARRQKVAEMYLSGRYQTDIAQVLGVDQSTISRDLTELRKEWLERSINHIDQKKAIELAKLDRLEVTYWEAWERSLKDAETTIEEHGGKWPKTVHKKEGQSGNPAFLEGVLKCIAQRCAIIGIEAPKKVAPTTPEGDKPYDASGLDRSVSTLADAIREALSGPGAAPAGDMAAPEQAPVDGAAQPGG